MGKGCLTKHAQAYQQKWNATFLFLTPFEFFSPAEHNSAPTGQDMDLHQKVPCPEDFLQSLPVANIRRVYGLWAIIPCYNSRQQRMPLVACVFLTASSLQLRNLRSCCQVALYPCSQPNLEWGAFPVCWQCVSWLPLAVGMEEGELLRYHCQDPCTHHCPPFSQVSLFARWSKRLGKEFAVVRSSAFQFWYCDLKKSFAVSMTILAAFWLLGCPAWTSGRELGRWDQEEYFVILPESKDFPTWHSFPALYLQMRTCGCCKCVFLLGPVSV